MLSTSICLLNSYLESSAITAIQIYDLLFCIREILHLSGNGGGGKSLKCELGSKINRLVISKQWTFYLYFVVYIMQE